MADARVVQGVCGFRGRQSASDTITVRIDSALEFDLRGVEISFY